MNGIITVSRTEQMEPMSIRACIIAFRLGRGSMKCGLKLHSPRSKLNICLEQEGGEVLQKYFITKVQGLIILLFITHENTTGKHFHVVEPHIVSSIHSPP
jgi:hypothetical protein